MTPTITAAAIAAGLTACAIAATLRALAADVARRHHRRTAEARGARITHGAASRWTTPARRRGRPVLARRRPSRATLEAQLAAALRDAAAWQLDARWTRRERDAALAAAEDAERCYRGARLMVDAAEAERDRWTRKWARATTADVTAPQLHLGTLVRLDTTSPVAAVGPARVPAVDWRARLGIVDAEIVDAELVETAPLELAVAS